MMKYQKEFEEEYAGKYPGRMFRTTNDKYIKHLVRADYEAFCAEQEDMTETYRAIVELDDLADNEGSAETKEDE